MTRSIVTDHGCDHDPPEPALPVRAGLFVAGVLAVIGSFWVGTWPALGSLLGRSTTYAPGWQWDAAHAVLLLAPGVLGVLFGGLVVAEARRARSPRRNGALAWTGVVLVACGVWFVVGTFAWPTITGSGGPYALASSTLRLSNDRFGERLALGLLLVAGGSFVAGWASRHSGPPAPGGGPR